MPAQTNESRLRMCFATIFCFLLLAHILRLTSSRKPAFASFQPASGQKPRRSRLAGATLKWARDKVASRGKVLTYVFPLLSLAAWGVKQHFQERALKLTQLQEMYEGSFLSQENRAQKMDSLKWKSHGHNKPLFSKKPALQHTVSEPALEKAKKAFNLSSKFQKGFSSSLKLRAASFFSERISPKYFNNSGLLSRGLRAKRRKNSNFEISLRHSSVSEGLVPIALAWRAEREG